MGRATQGVRLINLRKNDEIAAVCRTPKSEEEEEPLDVEGIEGAETADGTEGADGGAPAEGGASEDAPAPEGEE